VWLLKARFLNAIGFNRSAARMLDTAITRFTSAEERVVLLEDQSFFWAECEQGADALRSAEAAAGLGSTSLRTRYFRGRALALVGRLEEARIEMVAVLALEPENPHALRAIGMIDDALRPMPPRRLW
jgi:Flp pilus assembly protein TadD